MTGQKLADAAVVAHAAIVAWNEQLGNFEDRPWSLESDEIKAEFMARATDYAEHGTFPLSAEELASATAEQAMRGHLLAAVIDAFKENLP